MNKFVSNLSNKIKKNFLLSIIVTVLISAILGAILTDPISNFLWGQPKINVLTFRHDQTIIYGDKTIERFYFEIVNEGKVGVDIQDISMKSDKRELNTSICKNSTYPNFYLKSNSENIESFCFDVPAGEDELDESLSLLFYTDKGTIVKENILKVLWQYEPNLPPGVGFRVYGQILSVNVTNK